MAVKPPEPSQARLEHRTFLWLVIVVSLLFGWILWPFFGAILWGTVLAILFAPLHRWLGRKIRKPSLAALATLTFILLLVLLPLVLLSASLVKEAADLYAQVKSKELDFGQYFRAILGVLPSWLSGWLNSMGLTNFDALQERLSSGAMEGSKFLATRAFNFGQDAFDFILSFFIMLYLLFFLLRDGKGLARRIRRAIPLPADDLRELIDKFTAVIRATVKGNMIVAMAQGALGGLLFWFMGIHAPVLWGVLMAFLSLLPAIGAAIVWLPVGLYFLATGATTKGLIVIAFGVLVIGLVDNVLRPILVGKDTKIPDYVVLFSTLGGIAIFGFNGFVIGPVIAAMFIAAWDIFAKEQASGNAG